MAISATQLKQRLEEEKAVLIQELQKIGRINPDNADDWEPVAADLNVDSAEEEERAGEITNFEERSAVEFELEKRWNEVTAALSAIEKGTYGHCAVCKGEIEEARLMANPAATTCRTHME
jgi:DnaK suppressor protein